MKAFEQQLARLRKFRNILRWVAAACFIAAVVLLVRDALFVITAIRTDALVTDIDVESVRTDRSRRNVYCPTFEFQDTTGKQHTVKLNHHSSGYNYAVGQKVVILYVADEPPRVRVNSFMDTWGVGLMILGVSGLAAVFALAISAAEKNFARRVKERQGRTEDSGQQEPKEA